jgi:chromate reductase, NAD(P)H dehydrogenase (quinone)
MKILLFAASLRKGSINKKLLNLVARIAIEQSNEIEIMDFADFNVPFYNGDFENNFGIPDGAKKFIEVIQKVSGVIISSPEYNYSTPGVLKNLIDWTSRAKPMPLAKLPVMLTSASPSMVGGSRGLLHTATTLEACGVYVFSKTFSLANAYEAFANDGNFRDAELQQRLAKNISEFVEYAVALNKIKKTA